MCKKTITYLGFTLNKRGITTTQDNVDKIKNYPTPKTQREVRSFLGSSNFFRHLIKNYGIIAKPLYELTKKLKGKFQWNSEAESAFQELKTLLTTAPVLAYPDMNSEQPLILVCDTSSGGIGFLLSQKQRSDVSGKLVERPIFYGSTYLRDNQRKLGSSDLEITGIAFAIKKLDSWLRGHKFTLITDHKSLLYMINKNLDHFKPAMAKKIMFLQQYEFDIVHNSGQQIQRADALSRLRNTGNVQYEDVEPYIYNILPAANNNKQTEEMSKNYIDQIDINEVLRTQKLDPFYSSMLKYLVHNQLPADSNMSKMIKRHKNMYLVSNNLLYHIWHGKNGITRKQLCIPVELRAAILHVLHDNMFSGHIGAATMFFKALKKLYWTGLYKDIQNYVASCKTCMETNTGHAPKIPLYPLTVAEKPFTQIQTDILQMKYPSHGFKYILLMIDRFSNYVVLQKLRTKTASQVVNSLFKDWILKYGLMTHIISDNGLEFRNSLSKKLYELTGVKSVRTGVYRPSSNGLSERFNRQIIALLRHFTHKEPRNWSKYLPYVEHVINGTVSASTGCTAFSLVFGCERLSVLDLNLPECPENIPKTETQAHNYWKKNLERLRDYAIENKKIAKINQKRNYDRHARPHSFKVGQKVYIKLHHLGDTHDYKLRQQYRGVYTIHSFQSPTNVILVDEKGKQLPRSVYINNLKRFKERNVHVRVDRSPESDTDSDTTIIYDPINDNATADTDDNSSDCDVAVTEQNNSLCTQHFLNNTSAQQQKLPVHLGSKREFPGVLPTSSTSSAAEATPVRMDAEDCYITHQETSPVAAVAVRNTITAADIPVDTSAHAPVDSYAASSTTAACTTAPGNALHNDGSVDQMTCNIAALMEEDTDALVAGEPLRRNTCRKCTILDDTAAVRARVQLDPHPQHHNTPTQLNSGDTARLTADHLTSACFTAGNTASNLNAAHTDNDAPHTKTPNPSCTYADCNNTTTHIYAAQAAVEHWDMNPRINSGLATPPMDTSHNTANVLESAVRAPHPTGNDNGDAALMPSDTMCQMGMFPYSCVADLAEEVVTSSVTRRIEDKCTSPHNSIPQSTNSTEHQFDGIKKVLKTRTLAAGQIQYYITRRNNPAKNDRCWIEAAQLPLKLKQSLDKRQTLYNDTAINVMVETSVNTKRINCEDDWLSFNYDFALPMKQEFDYHNKRYTYYALNMYHLYIFYIHYILGHFDVLANLKRQGRQNCNLTESLDNMHGDIQNYVEPRLLYIVILRAMQHDLKIAEKLYRSQGCIIVEKHFGITLYTTMLMFIREQYITSRRRTPSIDLRQFLNPMPHIHGVTSDNMKHRFILKSYLRIDSCSPPVVQVDLGYDLVDRLTKLERHLI